MDNQRRPASTDAIGPPIQAMPKNENSTPPLTGTHLRTYNRIFQHPVSHNLEWRSVYALLKKLGQIAEEPNGNLKVTRNGQSLVLHRSYTKDVSDTGDLMAVRHFLEQSETPPPETNHKEAQWLVVIDHHEARIYRSAAPGAVPQQIRPHAPEDFFRHAHNSKEFSRGQEKPNPNSFFEPVAGVLNCAGEILIFGSGTGTSSEMDQFIAWLKLSRPELAKRIVGSLVVDENHLTEDQILAKAREFYASAPLS
jgi:hypothetical protein